MPIIINFSNFSTEKPTSEINIDWILSSFSGDEIKYKSNFEYLPWGYNSATTFNNALWLFRVHKDIIFKDYVLITNVSQELKKWIDNEKIRIVETNGALVLEIIETDNKHYIKIFNQALLKIPAISHFNKDINKPYADFFLGWLFEISLKFKGNFKILESDAYVFFDDAKHLKTIKRKKRSMFYLERYDNKTFINAGNEGALYLEGNKMCKYVFKKTINESILNERFSGFGFILDKIPEVYKELKMEHDENNDAHIFKYQDIVYPVNGLNFPDAAHSLIQQYKYNIIIDDNKLMNFGKVHKIGPIFKVIFNDFGHSFIEPKNNKAKEHYNEIFKGIIRDNFFLVEGYKNRDVRQKIRDKRNFKIKDLRKSNKSLDSFMKFIENNKDIHDHRNDLYVCHTLNFEQKVLKLRPEYVYVCQSNISTMKIKRETEKGIHYVYEIYNNYGNECACNNLQIESYSKFQLAETNDYKKELSSDLCEVSEARKLKVIWK